MWKKIWEKDERNIKSFMFTMIIFSGILFARFFAEKVGSLNATMFAFTYKYGFISRGLLGTIYQLLDRILPVNMMSYIWVYRFTFAMTLVLYLFIFCFFYICLKRIGTESLRAGKVLMVLLTVTAIPTFCGGYNFGRLDIYCVMLSILGAILMIERKGEWLLVPISALGVMFHQGNVFMFFNIILVLLICRVIDSEGKERRKYLMIFTLSFLAASVLFLWFELFSHGQGESIYEEVVANAKALCKNGEYHVDVVDKEILGIDLTGRETEYHIKNFVQFPIFLVLMAPYLVIGGRFFKRVIAAAETKLDKLKYVIVAIGAGTILPDLLLKVDYGRWVFAIICYYLVVLLALLAMRDRIIVEQTKVTGERLSQYTLAPLLLMYPVLFQPFQAMDICYLVAKLADLVNVGVLHLW